MAETDEDFSARRLVANRFQARHAVLLDRFRHVVADSTVLILGAGNGEWCYAYAAAGALNVVAIERDAELVGGFRDLPDIGLRERIDLRHGDPVFELHEEVRCARQHDIVVLFDMLRGQPDLHGFLRSIVALGPRMITFDDVFANTEEAIMLFHDSAGSDQPPLIPSLGALSKAASDCGLDVTRLDWSYLTQDERIGLSDYYTEGRVIRASFMLVPIEQSAR